jgi:hypothetical protein
VTTVLVPYWPAPGRKPLAEFVMSRYRLLHPELALRTAMACPPPWSKGRALNLAVGQYDPEMLVIADADCIIAADALNRAIGLAERKGWAVPASMVYRLSPELTETVLAGSALFDPEPVPANRCERNPYPVVPGGGILVATRQAWETVGGFDERFKGWKGEDVALGRALATLVGPPGQVEGPMWHLHHRPARKDRELLIANYHLEMDYRRATGSVEAMAELTREPRLIDARR